VHPEIVTRMRGEMRRLRSSSRPPAVIVVDAPLLVGSGLEAECDEIVLVDAPDEARVERTRRTRGWTEAVHRARERAQGDLARRRAAATRILENRGSVADLERAAENLYAGWAGPR
jgi:dephospho-CoA kinase